MVGIGLQVGDRFTMDLPVYRKWWQFWRPKIVGQESRPMIVTAAVHGKVSFEEYAPPTRETAQGD